MDDTHDSDTYTALCNSVCSASKLERDQAFEKLMQRLSATPPPSEDCIRLLLERCLERVETDSPWWLIHGSVRILTALLSTLETNQGTADIPADWEVLYSRCLALCTVHFTHEESRVRETLSALCATLSRRSQHIRHTLVSTVSARVKQLLQPAQQHPEQAAQQQTRDCTQLSSLLHTLAQITPGTPHTADPIMQELLYTQLPRHDNRFVRESVFCVLLAHAETLDCAGYTPSTAMLEAVTAGLEDNWSQVRLAAARVCRVLVTSEHVQLAAVSALVPRVCVNRHYVAEGVRAYSQNTWTQLVARHGPCMPGSAETTPGERIVLHLVESALDHYLCMTRADNHAVREAACHCVAETVQLLQKYPAARARMRAMLPALVHALTVCFGDACWPVRDTACVTLTCVLTSQLDDDTTELTDTTNNRDHSDADSNRDHSDTNSNRDHSHANSNRDHSDANSNRSHSDATNNSAHRVTQKHIDDSILSLTWTNVCDSVASVRQGGANSLAKLIKHNMLSPAQLNHLLDAQMLPALRLVTVEDGETRSVEDQHRHAREQHERRHVDAQMYSCGSLAPKMHAGGCSSGSHRRDAEDWEVCDGAVRLCVQLPAHLLTDHILEVLATLSHVRHLDKHCYLLETLCNCVPQLATSLGKRRFKECVATFYDCIFYGVACEDSELLRHAAVTCCEQLARILGPRIFRARVEMYRPQYAQLLDRCVPL